MIESGPDVEVIVHPISKGRPDRVERVAATRYTSDLQQRMNDRTAAQKFRRLISTNFKPGDLVVTLTYSDCNLPATPEQARDKKLKPFIKKVRADLREFNLDLKYLYVTEGLHGDKRLHHHIIVPNRGDIQTIIKERWTHGHVGFERIAKRGYDVWAGYLTKEPRKTGRHRLGSRMWTPSLNLDKPTITTYDVADDYQFELPQGVVVKDRNEVTTEWFTCQYVSYFRPDYFKEN